MRQAIVMIADAWNDVKQTTVANCWRHVGILQPSRDQNDDALLLLLLLLWSDRPRWPLDQHKCNSVKWEYIMYDGEKHCMQAKINMCVQGGLIQLISNKIIHRWLI